MMELTIPYDDSTRALGEPNPSDRYGGTTMDVSATRLTITGLPTGYSARLDFDVSVTLEGRKKRIHPYLDLDLAGTTGTCVVPSQIMAAAHDLRLPVQLVLSNGEETYASRNKLVLNISPSIDAKGTVEEAYGPDINSAIYQVAEEGGVLTFVALDGSTTVIRIDDDFLGLEDVDTVWPDEPSDERIPSTKLVKDSFIPASSLATSWSDPGLDSRVPSELLVKSSLDSKAEDADVVHIDVGTPQWDSTVTYAAGATVVHKLNLYISQNPNNLNHAPDAEGTTWWALVKGEGSGGGDEPGAYRVFKIGDGEATAFTLNHGLGSYNVDYVLYGTDGDMANTLASFRRYSKDHVIVTFTSPPAVEEYTIVVFRPGIGPEVVVTSINGVTGDVEFDPLVLGCVSIYPQTLTPEQQEQVKANIGWGESTLYTQTEKDKLAGIEDGAQANVQADWSVDDETSDAHILNRPTLGTASERDVGTEPGQVPLVGSTGKLDTAVIPTIALSEFGGEVATHAELVTISTAEAGDWALVTSDPDAALNGSYILSGIYSELSAWVLMAGPGDVLSVNAQVGAVVLDAADVGAVPLERELNGYPLSGDVNLTADDVGAVPSARLVNGHVLSEDVTLDADDVGAVRVAEGTASGTWPKVTVNEQGLVLSGEALAESDIPELPASRITSGTLAIARIPTGNASQRVPLIPSTGSPGQALRVNDAGTGFEWYTPSDGSLAMFRGTITGDGVATTFTLTHGLSGAPAPTLIGPDGRIVTTTMEVTDTSIVVTFHTAPEVGVTYTVLAVA